MIVLPENSCQSKGCEFSYEFKSTLSINFFFKFIFICITGLFLKYCVFEKQIIDPFVEVEIIGLPVDCCKDQTRVVDDNGKII